ncbi:hypothetical protein PHYBLDRAFT_149837 [Phycomyces blakesleeanus NRRL 1555(-)]|uniref:Uncharacterized protein n=1 Tax=Phycomyces blakesleeanus (strain ATCC 8743b / DSM 1359 / FGSC 10004 / NBRC 33097 / NRRL 1555) TaxID=763407 RepID=A0A167KTC1_PHYB8|nr:hypothetical protein PHYBLDRAFT_149837 [Phycomyces blakesleeanus NRRL 1555(-)]OAD68827.1 hypothetical protein PHYBLDRAFT_149837 [Phycomyces blakesleeanus NRRL 1555(-)]|eukprot:XP_018286867.1 hypothetical protein PHYBLDRAFT_149837 [Phycomyces blakesleeanus NRRL 1555(-)]
MLSNPTHTFIAYFAAFFISKYVVNSEGVVLIKFINEVLGHFGQLFHLPLSMSSLYFMTGLTALTKGVQRFIVCSQCNMTYHESLLFLESSRIMTILKKVYQYNSIINSLSMPFYHPGFEEKINEWRS